MEFLQEHQGSVRYIPVKSEPFLTEYDYGSFLCFDALTLVPFERSAIIAEELSTKEKEWLNKYHQKVFETIAPYLTEEEAGWLREETQEF